MQKQDIEIKIETLKNEINKLIKEAEFKIEVLPESYFINYFKDVFIKEMKKIIK